MSILARAFLVSITTLGLVGATAPRVASAQTAPPADSDRARDAKKRGDLAMDELRYDDALAAYAEAYALTQNPALLYNQARAHQARGDYPEALRFLEAFARAASPDLKARVPGLQEIVDEVQAHVATLRVSCNVEGAEVRLGDRVLGTTPLVAPIQVNAGRATLRVIEARHRPFEQEVVLSGGGTVAVRAELLLRDASGVIVVRSDVAGAEVVVDGKAAGAVPAEIPLSPGTHGVEVTRAGYERAKVSVVLGAGERKEVTVPLAAEGPITSRWWFWTGIAVVVAGGVTTYVALTTERAADKGTLAPSQVSAPLVRF